VIIRPEGDQLEFYAQEDHAYSAMTIARQFGGNGYVDCGGDENTLELIRRHDIGWKPYDASPMIDSEGQPRDFRHMPAPVMTLIWKECVKQAYLLEGNYGYAVVSGHFSRLARQALHSNHRPAEDIFFFQQFLAEQEKGPINIPFRESGDMRHFVRKWGAILQASDTISVFMLTSSDTQPMMKTAPIRLAAKRSQPLVELELFLEAPRRISLRPWPFRLQKVLVQLRCRVLPRRPYASDEDLQETYALAPEEWRDYEIWPMGD